MVNSRCALSSAGSASQAAIARAALHVWLPALRSHLLVLLTRPDRALARCHRVCMMMTLVLGILEGCDAFWSQLR